MAPNEANGTLSGNGGPKTFVIKPGSTTTITDFGGVGPGVNPSDAVIAEVDTLKFNKGNGLEAPFLRLTQQGDDLLITFGLDDTQVILKDFNLEDLENLQTSTGASVDIGNILFQGQTQIQDSFDVIDADQNPSKVFNPNTVTFLNDLDNTTQGQNNSDDTIHGQGGNDTLKGGTGNDDLYGGEGNDFLDGGVGSDFVYGGEGDDTMYATKTDDFDYLNGEAGNDSLYGGAGNNSLSGGAGNDILKGGAGNDTLNGEEGNDILKGGAGNDTFDGGAAGNDILKGGAGEDDLSFGQGNDILNGGDGFDFVSGVGTIDLAAGTASGAAGKAVLSNIEGIRGSGTLIGDEQNNVLEGYGVNSILYGGAGNDILSADQKSTLYGGSGNDFLGGSDGDENGRGANDTLFGGSGDDRLEGEAGNDRLEGGAGDDFLDGDGTFGNGKDILKGGSGNDTLEGDEGNDKLNGGTGDDRLNGGEGNDTLNGGDGFDFVEYFGFNSTAVTVDLAAGTASVEAEYDGLPNNDVLFNIEGVFGSLDNDTLIGNEENNILEGSEGKDTLTGGDGDDILNGGSNNDKLSGGEGNDILTGGIGFAGEIDTLSGGAGEDRFIFGDLAGDFYEDRDPTTVGKKDYALIKDFNPEADVIQLSGDKSDYVLKPSPSGVPVGTGLFVSSPEGEPDELISIIQGSGSLSLDSNAFDFNSPLFEFNIANLNGRNGLVYQGTEGNDSVSDSVSIIGDINSDGFDDLVIETDGYGSGSFGDSFVVFGKADGFEGRFNPDDLNGSNGFVVNNNAYYDYSSTSVNFAGDINGDNLDDLIIDDRSGDSFVVFGKADGFEASFNPDELDGNNGFVINDNDAESSSAGDVNGDGFNDLLIGDSTSGQYGSGMFLAGRSYVVFGKAEGFSPSLNPDDLDGSNGFVINGNDEYDYLGSSVSSEGDINGDGFDDLVIGATGASGYYQNEDSKAYVIFGKAEGFSPSLNPDDLDGSNGFVINSIGNEQDFLGFSVNIAGDVNGDGFNDIILGALYAGSPKDEFNRGPGEVYVVFGQAGGFSASLNLADLNGSNGFVLQGRGQKFDSLGYSVSTAGDVNGDGFDDLLIEDSGAEETYVVFGKAEGFDSSLDLTELDDSDGFVLKDSREYGSASVSAAGDINGDGFDDLVVGDLVIEPNDQYGDPVERYVTFAYGRDFTGQVNRPGTSGNDTLTGTSGDDILIGGLGNDILLGQAGSDVLKGGGGNDILGFDTADKRLEGDAGTDTLQVDSSGVALDFTTIANNKITGIEVIDLTGTGNNSLTFSRLDLLDLSDTTNQLIVKGNTGDAVSSTGQGWSLDGTATLDDTLYNRYTAGAATLLVGTTLSQTLT